MGLIYVLQDIDFTSTLHVTSYIHVSILHSEYHSTALFCEIMRRLSTLQIDDLIVRN